MKLVVGLGNPEPKHRYNRHNIGFIFVDFLQEKIDPKARFCHEEKFKSLVCQLKYNADDLLLVKPQTYMNNSGIAVKALIDFYKLKPHQDLLLIHDDLDIAFGHYKLSHNKGPKQHNGVNNIVDQLHTSDFCRLRLGIAGLGYQSIKQQGLSLADNYVLKDFSQTEMAQLPALFATALEKTQEVHCL
ncbi:aminoacyl-tRNA hydrolase [Candidatus Beckwithbacteria bacterium]|nr:aminoacyl-tRNA hydrolase [Candidatus Beckwithbacteria bacterium]